VSSKPRTSRQSKQPSTEVGREEGSDVNPAREQEIGRRAYEFISSAVKSPAMIWRIGSKPNVNSEATRSPTRVSRLRSLIKQQRNKT
jgi:hypothetical protein